MSKKFVKILEKKESADLQRAKGKWENSER